jgi:hypothetical protein
VLTMSSVKNVIENPAAGLAMPGSASPLPPLPWVPPGDNPETYDIEKVNKVLKSAAYFPIFNISNPATPNHPNYLIPGLPVFIRSVDVNEQLHRFELDVWRQDRELCAAKRIGESVASVHIQWTPIPEFYAASPTTQPPLWLLNPFLSQRFCMLGGQLDFKDNENSGVHAFGTGRTFPVVEGGKSRLRIGAAIEVLEGFGKFKGLQGAFCINGYIEPPNSLALNLMIRMMDPEKTLQAVKTATLAPLEPVADPDPDGVFMAFLGEVDPERGVELIPAPDGSGFIGSKVHELLRLVHFDFDMASPAGLRSLTREGPIVGRVEAKLYFNVLDPAQVIPIQTTDGVFTFYDQEGSTIGKIFSNMVEGRALRTQIAGLPMPLFRFVGFGPVLGGTGQFSGADGLMTLNSAVSVFPRTLSNLYIFRFYDPQMKLRGLWRPAAR